MRCLGIDLGTSLSSAAVIEDGKPAVLRVDTAASTLLGDSYSIPSSIFIEENGNILLGQAADNSRMKDPGRYRKEFKRDLGAIEPYRIGEMELYPQDIYREFLKYFKKKAEERLGGTVEKVVITHPAAFAGYKKELVLKAAQQAGFAGIELIDEPTAAAVYYSHKEKIEVGQKLLIYDLGGGTFDVSLITREEKGFKPLTIALGIERCGGADFQRKIYESIMDRFKGDMEPVLSAGGDAARQFKLMIEMESIKIKHYLSTAKQAETAISIPGIFQFRQYRLTREEFEAMIRDEVEATAKKMTEIVKNAGLKMGEIDRVLLVGGSSRIPCIEEMIAKTVGKGVCKDADIELVVCLGAAIYAGRSIFEVEAERRAQEQSRLRLEQQDEELWRTSTKKNTVEAYEGYLSTQISGRHREEAMEKIKGLREVKERKEEEKRQQEKKKNHKAANESAEAASKPEQKKEASGKVQPKCPRVRCISGFLKGCEISLGRESVIFGRDRMVCRMLFPQDAAVVSRRHCTLYHDQKTEVFVLEDNFSTNGTFLMSGERLERGRSYYLKCGDKFYLSNKGNVFEVLL